MSTTTELPPQVASDRAILTTAQAAAYLQVRPQTLANMRCDSTGPKFLRRGRIVRYRLAELDRWLEKTSK